MQALSAAFKRLRQQGRKALIPFIVGGDPSLSETARLILALQDAGADAVEVGIPFSDPLADGPVIQAASARALARGATPQRIFQAVGLIRNKLRVPLICLTYYNPVIQFGGRGSDARCAQAFLKAASDSGFCGIIVPDVPVEEGVTLRTEAARAEIAAVFLAAPTSTPQRLRSIARASTGFIYYVSVTGTTGVRQQLSPQLLQGVRQLKLLTAKPVCVGFGISTPEQASAVARVADGVIVGSALVRVIAEAPRGSAVSAASRFIRRLRQAI